MAASGRTNPIFPPDTTDVKSRLTILGHLFFFFDAIQMQSFNIIRASSLLPYIKFLDNLGSPVDRLLEKYKLNRDLIYTPNAFVIERQRSFFIDHIARLEGIENLGGLVSLNSSAEAHGLLGKIAMQKPTLEEALQTVCFLIGKHNSRLKNKVSFTINQTVATVSFQQFSQTDFLPGHQHTEQTLFLAFFKLIQKYLGKKDKLCQFYIPNTRAFNYWRSSLLFDVQQWHLSNSSYAITFPSNLLYTRGTGKKLKIPQSDVKSWIGSQTLEPFSEKVNLLMPSLVEQGIIKITDIADLIGISERTLRRRLENSGTSYTKILQQTRFAIAKQKLINSNDSITEIAFLLGYEHPQHFSRVFKSWSGMSPRAFQKIIGQKKLSHQ